MKVLHGSNLAFGHEVGNITTLIQNVAVNTLLFVLVSPSLLYLYSPTSEQYVISSTPPPPQIHVRSR